MKKFNKLMVVMTVALGVGLAGTVSANAEVTKNENSNQTTAQVSHANRPINLEFVSMPMH
ncbi:hypothetical protein [Furfurilactobacillus milii]|uniref:Uncharacterized protein n=1 Tax=Furfurilactobacillus milii TaxID=2888272 RepID=A0A6N9HZP8_9LACO|nr:hypothetical protein [Furfurilactobacillus milii]MYV16048.1 hypothetical protein [Furfurilactobacillus milii]